MFTAAHHFSLSCTTWIIQSMPCPLILYLSGCPVVSVLQFTAAHHFSPVVSVLQFTPSEEDWGTVPWNVAHWFFLCVCVCVLSPEMILRLWKQTEGGVYLVTKQSVTNWLISVIVPALSHTVTDHCYRRIINWYKRSCKMNKIAPAIPWRSSTAFTNRCTVRIQRSLITPYGHCEVKLHQCKIIKCINQSEHNCINKSGTCSIYSINYMFRPLHWPS